MPWLRLRPKCCFPPKGKRRPRPLAGDTGVGRDRRRRIRRRPATPGCCSRPIGRSVADGDPPLRRSGMESASRSKSRPGSESRFHILALDATGPGNAWAIAEADRLPEPLGRASGADLDAGSRTALHLGRAAAEWVARSPTVTTRARASPTRLLSGRAQPLTVTSDGVWIDLAATDRRRRRRRHPLLRHRHRTRDRLLVRCRAPRRRPLGAKLSRQGGYRSFAWPGGAFGSRIITNPLDPGGGEDSNRGTYLRFSDGAFARMPGGGGNFRSSGAFVNADSGWLEGPVEISPKTAPSRLQPWPCLDPRPANRCRRRLRAAPPGSLDSGALAVGADGSVVRYEPGRGWEREFLLSSSGGGQQVDAARRRLARTGARSRGRRPGRDVAVERGR